MRSSEEAHQFYQESGRRFAAHFLALAQGASENLRPGLRWNKIRYLSDPFLGVDVQLQEQEAISALEQDRNNLLHAIEEAHALQEWTIVCELTDELAIFFHVRSYWSDWVRTAELAVADAIHTADLRLEAEALNNLAVVYRQLERLQEAADCCQRSLTLYQQLGDNYGEGLVLGNLGGIYLAEENSQASLECYEAALKIFRELDDEYGQAQSLMGLGISLARQGKFSEAATRLNSCLNIEQRLHDRFGQAQTLNNLGIIQRRQGLLSEAIASFQASLRIKRELGDRQGITLALNNLAVAYRQSGALDQAVVAWEEALSLIGNLHLPEAERVAQRLARVLNQRQSQQENEKSTT